MPMIREFVRIFENDNFTVDYDKYNNQYRVSYFEDNNFKEECYFDAYEKRHQIVFKEEVAKSILETLNSSRIKTYHQECREKTERRLENILKEKF